MNETRTPEKPILIVDDEESALLSFEMTLNSAKINHLVLCNDSRLAMKLLAENDFEMILLDLTMPNISGEELIPQIVQNYPNVPIIIITGNIEVYSAVKCMKLGAFDYMVKPIDEKRLVNAVKLGLHFNRLQRENSSLKQQLLNNQGLSHPEAFTSITTRNATMFSIFKYIEVIANSPEPVLLTGETGVGKELIAQAIHTVSNRHGRFVPVNSSGLDNTIFSDTLFGHKKGAFTDAYTERKGLIETAENGTLFLDEIGDLKPALQVKLLRLLQENEFTPLGSDLPKYTNAHFVTATNRNLEQAMEAGQFRKDLFYRLSVHHIHIPPLRERSEDIPLLLEFFVKEAAIALGKKKPGMPKELVPILSNYPFPGNIRELRSMVFTSVSLCRSHILPLKSFKDYIELKKKSNPASGHIGKIEDHFFLRFSQPLPSLKQVESKLIMEALKLAGGNQSIAAQIVGISRQTLNRKIKSR